MSEDTFKLTVFHSIGGQRRFRLIRNGDAKTMCSGHFTEDGFYVERGCVPTVSALAALHEAAGIAPPPRALKKPPSPPKRTRRSTTKPSTDD